MKGLLTTVVILAALAGAVIGGKVLIEDDEDQAKTACRFTVYTGRPVNLTIPQQPACEVTRQRLVPKTVTRARFLRSGKLGDCTALLPKRANKHRRVSKLNGLVGCPRPRIIVFNPGQ